MTMFCLSIECPLFTGLTVQEILFILILKVEYNHLNAKVVATLSG